MLRPDGNFTCQWTGCTGPVAQAFGKSNLSNEEIHLIPSGKRDQQAQVLVPVRWGARLYLIEKGNLLDFCNDINAGTEPRKDIHGRCYIREGDEKKQTSGYPELPQEWRGFMLQKPVHGSVPSQWEQLVLVRFNTLLKLVICLLCGQRPRAVVSTPSPCHRE